jgi:hypothetical protein
MRNTVIGITVMMLIVTGILSGNTVATAFTGTVSAGPRTSHSLIQKADCDQVDNLCEQGKQLVCSPGTPNPSCTCDICPGPGFNTFCPCPHGRSCVYLGHWYGPC